jgi:hypothetical protein
LPNLIDNFISSFQTLQTSADKTHQTIQSKLEPAQQAATNYLHNRDNAVDLARNLNTADAGLSTARDFFHSLENLFQIPSPNNFHLREALSDVKSRARDFVTGFITYLKSDENILRRALGYNDSTPREIFNTNS